MMNKNVIFILIDGARADRIKQFPNLSKLSKNGTFLSNGCTYAPYTIASMHAIFSGVFGNKNGTDNYYGTYNFKAEEYATLAEYFKENDFITYGDTINDLVVPKKGFDVLTIHDEYNDNLTERHKKLIEDIKQKSKKQNKPFFLYLHYSNIHTEIKLNVLDKYDNFSKEYFDNIEENKRKYDSYFSKADAYIGEIVKQIEKEDLIKNSIIFITADHGISIGEKFGEMAYGAFCYENTTKTFLICLGDMFLEKEVNILFRTVDITPTIINIMGFDTLLGYKKFDGISLMSLIEEKENVPRIAFIQSGNPGNGNPPRKPNVHAIKREEWKLIFNELDNKYELYNLNDDPHETNNAYNLEPYQEIQTELRELLNKHLQFSIIKIGDIQTQSTDNKIEKSSAEIGYWNSAYLNLNYFGSGPTKLAYKAADYIIEKNTKNILELGAGQGRDSLYFTKIGCNVTAVDYAENAIKSIREIASYYNENIKPFVYDITKELPFKDNSFDCVYSNLVFQFLNKQQLDEAIKEIHRILKPEGLFIASVKNYKDKYYSIGKKLDENSTESKGIIRYFLNENETKELIKHFELLEFYEDSHINLDRTKSCYWCFIVKKA